MSAKNEEYFLIESSLLSVIYKTLGRNKIAIVCDFTPLRNSIIIEAKLQKNTE